jgi:hypothetical protein
MNRQKLILFVLLLAFAGSLAYSYLRFPRQREVAQLANKPGVAAPVARKAGATQPKVAVDEGRVHLELLGRELPRFSGFRRNIFSPIFREEVKLPPFKPLPPPPKPVLALPPPPRPQPLPAPPPPPTLEQIADSELAKFTFLGFLEKNGEKTVFLSSNNEIFLAKKGSNLGQKFQVTGLTSDAITIKSVEGGREIVIPLVENRALSTRRTSKP